MSNLRNPAALEPWEDVNQGETKWRMEERHDMIINALKRGTTPEQLIHLMGFAEDEIVECQKKLEATK